MPLNYKLNPQTNFNSSAGCRTHVDCASPRGQLPFPFPLSLSLWFGKVNSCCCYCCFCVAAAGYLANVGLHELQYAQPIESIKSWQSYTQSPPRKKSGQQTKACCKFAANSQHLQNYLQVCVLVCVCGVGQLYVIGNIHKLCQIFWARFIDQYAKMAATVALVSLSLLILQSSCYQYKVLGNMPTSQPAGKEKQPNKM